MDTTRETKELKVGEHIVVIKTYCTGREYNAIELVYLTGANVSREGAEVVVKGFNPTVEQEASQKAIEMLVVSLDGDANDILNRILDLPHPQYLEVVQALGEVSGKKKASA